MMERRFVRVTPLVVGTILLLSVGLQGGVSQSEVCDDSCRQANKEIESQGEGWLIEVVDPDTYTNGFRIAVDGNNVPHIAYMGYDMASDSYVLRYTNRTDGTWKGEDLDPQSGFHAAIAVDKTNKPHIVYNSAYDCEPGCVKHTNWTGNEWNTTVLDSGLGIYAPVSIALNSKDYPHMIYPAPSTMHVNWTGNEWNYETLTFAGRPDSVALDDKDFPHISYVISKRLEYAKWNGASWVVQVVVNYSVVLTHLDLDSRNNPHIVFTIPGGDDLRYARWNGSAWEIEVVESGGKYIGYIAVDRFDRPHLVYKRYDLHPVAIRYAIRIDGSWQIDTVDSIPHISNDFPIAVDNNGNPHLSYHDHANHQIRYATKQIEMPSRNITLDIDPDTLNLKSRGRWITAYLRTDSAKAEDINASSLVLNDIVSPAWWDIQDENVLMVKFDRAAVQAILPVSDSVNIEITGQWMDGEGFEAHDTIRVIDPVQSRRVLSSFLPKDVQVVSQRTPRDLLPDFESLSGQRK